MVNSLKWTTVDSKEVEQSKYRLEASVFNLEAKAAKQSIDECSSPKVPLWGEGGLIEKAFYPGRFKRIYVEKGNGHPMVLPSQMLSIKPIATKFISDKTYETIGNLDLKQGQLLLTRSGTIGNCTIVTKTLENTVMSDDVIRITFNEGFDLGFVYAFFKTKVGQLVLATNNYGSVVLHIEPEHLKEVIVPKPKDELRKSIHEKIIKSFSLRDQSNDLIDKAEKRLIEALNLPSIDQFEESNFKNNTGIKNYSVSLNLLDDRFDASYHLPIVDSIIDVLLDNTEKIIVLGNDEISKQIILPGRFKRVYVEEREGKVLFGGKQIYEIDPSNKKYLSLSIHGKRIEEQLVLHQNMILVTRSGTIGRVNIVPSHWENWVANDHIIRVVPRSSENAGFIYIWLNSDYGNLLINKLTYGSVVDEIEVDHLKKVPIPILKNENLMKEINDLALQANKLRSEAYYLEQEAIRQVNEEVIYC